MNRRAGRFLADNLSASEPGIEWSRIAGMRDVIARHYWRVSETLLWETVQKSLPPKPDCDCEN